MGHTLFHICRALNLKLVINIIAGRQTIQDPSANCSTAAYAASWQLEKGLRSSLTSYTHTVSTHNSMVSLHLLWIRRLSCANTTVQLGILAGEAVSSSSSSAGPDCAERGLAVCSAHSPLGNFPLSSKLNACRKQKPNRGNKQLKESYFVTYSFRNALVLPFTFYMKTRMAYCMVKRLCFLCICVSQIFPGLPELPLAGRVSPGPSLFPAVSDAGGSSPWDTGDLLLG